MELARQEQQKELFSSGRPFMRLEINNLSETCAAEPAVPSNGEH
jgi:hypothetical protein